MNKLRQEFFCPYCESWTDEENHEQGFHNNPNKADELQDYRVRLNGVIYLFLD